MLINAKLFVKHTNRVLSLTARGSRTFYQGRPLWGKAEDGDDDNDKNTSGIKSSVITRESDSSLQHGTDKGMILKKVPSRIQARLERQEVARRAKKEALSKALHRMQEATNSATPTEETSSEETLGLWDIFGTKGEDRHASDEKKDAPKEATVKKPFWGEDSKLDPSYQSILLFPGQGSQFVGMGKKLLQYPGVPELYERASSILGYDILALCLLGPKEELDKTLYCQPAVVVTSLAALQMLRLEKPQVLERCHGCAGLSVGEITAMIFCGFLSVEDGLKLVKVRASAMHKASVEVQGGMSTAHCYFDTKFKFACEAAKKYATEIHGVEDPSCNVAIYLGPYVRSIAGNVECLDFLHVNAKELGFKKVMRLPVSGAFHTKLMKPAAQSLVFSLSSLNVNNHAECYLFQNWNAKPIKRASINTLSRTLSRGLTQSVYWEQIMMNIYRRDADVPMPSTYEVGPGRQLGTLLRTCNRRAYEEYNYVQC